MFGVEALNLLQDNILIDSRYSSNITTSSVSLKEEEFFVQKTRIAQNFVLETSRVNIAGNRTRCDVDFSSI